MARAAEQNVLPVWSGHTPCGIARVNGHNGDVLKVRGMKTQQAKRYCNCFPEEQHGRLCKGEWEGEGTRDRDFIALQSTGSKVKEAEASWGIGGLTKGPTYQQFP